MNTIRVAAASAFFQERGFDAHGIFTLLFNALYREDHSYVVTDGITGVPPDLYFSYAYINLAMVNDEISEGLRNFKGDLTFAQGRIEKYNRDYMRLKDLDKKISRLRLKDFLFRRKSYVKELFRERRQLVEMQISVSDLVEVAYYKYVAENLGEKEDFVREMNSFITLKTSL